MMGSRGLTSVAVWLWLTIGVAGCIVINDLPPFHDKQSDAGAGKDAGPEDGGGRDGGDSGAPCVPGAEICNGLDDDCDGVSDDDDPDTQAYCEGQVVNAVTFCGEVTGSWVCVPLECREGFTNCDGNHGNGCEPFCSCNECPDAGSDDGGTDDAGAL